MERGGGNESYIDDRPTMVDDTRHIKSHFQTIEQFFAYTVFLDDVAEIQERGSIENLLLSKIDTHEFAKSVAVIAASSTPSSDRLNHTCRRIHSQHLFNALRRTPSLTLVIERFDIGAPIISDDYFIHCVEERFSLGRPLTYTVFDIAEALLPIHILHRLVRFLYFTIQRAQMSKLSTNFTI